VVCKRWPVVPFEPIVDLEAMLSEAQPQSGAAAQCLASLRAAADVAEQCQSVRYGGGSDGVYHPRCDLRNAEAAPSGVRASRSAATELGLSAQPRRNDRSVHGQFASPNFQQGTPPYWTDGGGIDLDAKGNPKVVRTESLRFALAIPNATMPPDGWPVILYAHGTGGDYQTFVRESLDLRAALIERKGQPPTRMAMIGIDQVLHGPRDPSGSNAEITFFNLQNLAAARDNVRQGATDDFQLLRLVEGMDVAKAPHTGQPIRFDKRRIYFMGHSQGGLTGPLFLAAEPKVPVGVLSGAGSVLILSLLNKTEPNNIAELVESLLQEPPLVDHPLLNLLQAYFEPADPNNYGRLYFQEPPKGMPPKSIFQSLGLWDHYTPVPNIAAFALAMGVQPVEPRLYELPFLR
jgi:predicted esterase